MKIQPIKIGIASVLTAGLIALGGGVAMPKADAASLNTNSNVYNVSIDDMLSQIAQNYGIDLNKLLASNPSLQNGSINCPGLNFQFPVQNGGGKPANGGTVNNGSGTGHTGNTGTGNTGSGNTGSGNTGTGNTGTGNTGSGSANGGTTGTVSQSEFASQVITLVNQERAKAGLGALKSDALLTKVATDKAKDMYTNNYFDHNSPTYGSPFDMMRAYGVTYSYAGENIAKGQRSPSEVMTAWMNSEGHRANILNGNYNKIGVAYYNGEWVQEFTS